MDNFSYYSTFHHCFVCKCGGAMQFTGGIFSDDYRATMIPVLECEQCGHSVDIRLILEETESTLRTDPMFITRVLAAAAIWDALDRVAEYHAAMQEVENDWANLFEIADREMEAEETGIAVEVPFGLILPIERMLVR
jgi:hypothetical protein